MPSTAHPSGAEGEIFYEDYVNTLASDDLVSSIVRPSATIMLITVKCTKIVDHSDVVGASPVGAAPTTSSFPT